MEAGGIKAKKKKKVTSNNATDNKKERNDGINILPIQCPGHWS